MATIYYEIIEGDAPFTVNINGDSVDITEVKGSTGTYYFTNLPDDTVYVITVTSATGCVRELENIIPSCVTTTTTAFTCNLYAEITSLCDFGTTTTTTTQELGPVIECLEGLTIEAISLRTVYDYSLMPPEYVHPCYYTIGQHYCNRALFEVFANGNTYLGDFRMNNAGGTGGGVTAHSGNQICGDYGNKLPYSLTGGNEPSTDSRYEIITVTPQQANDIAVANGGSHIIDLSMEPAMITYGATCSDETVPHEGITWVRVTNGFSQIVYNGCPEGYFLSVDVCTPMATTTTTSTTILINTMFVYYDVL